MPKIHCFLYIIFCVFLFIGPTNIKASTDFTKLPDLKIGDIDRHVINLQKILNLNGFIVNKEIGQPGSINNETERFGDLTKDALINFQLKYSINPVLGYFGSKTKTKINELIKSGNFKEISEGSPIASSVQICPSDRNLNSHIKNEVDSRIQGVSANDSTKSLWTTRGDNTGGWVWNTNIWTNRNSVIDWTGMSPWNSEWAPTAPYVHAGTLISPKHMVYNNHYQISNGAKVIFIDSSTNVIERTVVDSRNVGEDIQVVLLNEDVPPSVTYYPIISYSELNNHLSSVVGLPLVMFDQDDHAVIGDVSGWAYPQVSHYQSADTKRAEFWEGLIVGDSGNPGFFIINGKPVLVLTHWHPDSGPNYSMFYDQINNALDSLGGGYRITDYSLDCFKTTPYSITSSTSGTGGGSIVDSLSGVNIIKIQRFEEGPLTLMASSTVDSVFNGWSGDCSGSGNCVMTMDGNKTISADFTRNPPVIISPTNNQTIGPVSSVTVTWTGNSPTYQAEIQDITSQVTIPKNFLRTNSLTFDVVPGHTYKFWIQGGLLTAAKRSTKAEINFTVSSPVVQSASLEPNTTNTPADKDFDGVADADDKCSSTPSSILKININKYGCPNPVVANTSKTRILNNIDNTDLTNIQNLEIEDKNSLYGKIKFNEIVNIFGSTDKQSQVDIDQYVNISDKKISINSFTAPQFNKSATITFYNVNLKKPVIKKDGKIYATTTATLMKHDTVKKTVSFAVEGFSVYEIIEDSAAVATVLETKKNPTLYASKQGTGSGLIVGIDSATTDFVKGDYVKLTAQSKPGSIFTGWSGSCSGTDECVIFMDSDKSINAIFSLNSTSTATSDYIFNKDLTLYKKDIDVQKLQQYLNTKNYLVASSGPGSLGYETTYFGPATKSALIKFQLKNNIKPSVGYFGKITRTLINNGLGL